MLTRSVNTTFRKSLTQNILRFILYTMQYGSINRVINGVLLWTDGLLGAIAQNERETDSFVLQQLD